MYKFYSAFITTVAVILFLCSSLGEKLLAQTGSSAELRFGHAMMAYDSTDHLLATQKFQQIIDDYCSMAEYGSLCFEAKLILTSITRAQTNLDEAGKMLADLKDFVLTNLDGDINKLVHVYAHNVFLANQQSNLENSQKWATKLREVTRNNEVETLPLAWSYSALGHNESMAGNYRQAITYYREGIELAESINDRDQTGRLLISIYNNLGIPYRRIGEPLKAMEQYQKSLDIIREVHGDDHIEIGTAYNNIGTIYYIMQDIGQAAEYFVRAAGIVESNLGPDHSRLGASLNNAGVSYYSLKNYELAARYLERAQRVKEEDLGLDHIETAIGYSNLASIHIQNEDYSAAESNYLRSIEVRKNVYGDSHPQLIDPIFRLGKLYANQLDNLAGAREQYELALSICIDRLGETHPEVAHANFLIGKTYYKQQNYDEARRLFQRSIELLYGEYALNEKPDMERPVTEPVKLIQVLHYKSKLFREKSEKFNETNYQLALHALDWAVDIVDLLQNSYQNEASKLRLIDQNYSIYTDAIEILAALYLDSKNEQYKERIFEYMEESRSRVSLELIQQVSARTFAGVPEEIIKEDEELNSQITRLQHLLYSEQEKGIDKNSDLLIAYQDSVFRKKRELEQFTRNLEQEYPAYFTLKYDQSVLSLNEAQALLNDDETIVSYVFGEEKIHAYIVTPTEANVVELGKTVDVNDFITGIRDEVISGKTKGYINSAHALYKHLFEPVEPFLSGDKVLIMADQRLHYLPFELLLTGLPDHEDFQEMPYLLNNYTISYIPSATIFNTMIERRPDNPRNLLAVAPFSSEIIRPEDGALDVQYASTLGPLFLTKYETQSITGLFQERRSWSEYFRPQRTKLLMESDATLEQFSKIELSKYNFIHFATHAFINENNPQYSGIIMYPHENDAGIAYVADIYNMEFNADLVVLGACDTGLGTTFRGEGLIGFTRAFIYAGASNLAVSMWKVNDQATAYLMIDFYDYIRDGYSYSEALRLAKLNIINKPHLADPVNWAAFILTGR
ncbi:tetratricopeptide repeat protein [soil metagenome]